LFKAWLTIGCREETNGVKISSVRNGTERNRKQRPKLEDEQGIDCGNNRMTIRVEIDKVEDKETGAAIATARQIGYKR